MKSKWSMRVVGAVRGVCLAVVGVIVCFEIVLAVRLAGRLLWAACPWEEVYKCPCEERQSFCKDTDDKELCTTQQAKEVYVNFFCVRPSFFPSYVETSTTDAPCYKLVWCEWDESIMKCVNGGGQIERQFLLITRDCPPEP